MNDDERTTLARMLEILIPGALQAGVPGFVEREAGAIESIRSGLAELVQRGFLTMSEAAQTELVAASEGGDFFETLRLWAIRGLICDPKYGGNEQGRGWELIGYPGPRQVWPASAQVIRPISRETK